MILRKLTTLIRMAPAQQLLVAEALFWLAFARLSLLVVPFRLIAARLGTLTPPDEAKRLISADGADTEQAIAIGRAVRRAAANAPFRAVCLQQAIAAKVMLRRRGIGSALHFGMVTRLADRARRPHAWLDVDQTKITGYPIRGEVVELACFL